VTEGIGSFGGKFTDPSAPIERGEWPDWEISERAFRQLAQYVDPEATEIPLGAHLRGDWTSEEVAGAEATEARAAKLYRLVSERDIQYARDPWNPTRFGPDSGSWKQRIRTPAEVLQGVGSCLDLSLLFAGMAMAAGIRPFIALTLNAPTPHALVVLDLLNPLSEDQAKREEGPAHWQLDKDGHGVWLPEIIGEGSAPPTAPWWQLNRSQWLVVDITCASRMGATPPSEFEQACLPALPWASAASAVSWMLLDTEAAMDGQTRYVPPAGRARYPIHSYLPELPEFRDYLTRRGLIRELGQTMDSGSLGRLVLQGPGGRGKSLLAQRLAWGADNGCGWFLNATDVPTLRASLAAAEQAEIGQRPQEDARAEQPNAAEVTQLAYAAIARLNTATVPWVVVLDNCDVSPAAPGLRTLIPQPRIPGQIVILTTRNEEWATALDDWTFRPVPALGAEDLKELGLSADLARTAEDPLVAEPLAALLARGATLPESGQRDPRELIWLLVRDALGPGSEAVRLAELLAWLPPEPADVDTAPVGTDLLRRRRAADELVRLRFLAPVSRLGELTPSSVEASEVLSGRLGESDVAQQPRLVQMHRMLADAIREKQWAEGNSAVLDVLAKMLTSTWGRRAFIQAADSGALVRLEGSDLERAAEAAADGRAKGLAWQGLGHIRERRGPVVQSGTAFKNALTSLAPDTDPYEVAEARIGLARIAFQESRYDLKKLREAQATIQPAGELLAKVAGTDARQLQEQGNALYWLIERRIADKEKDPRHKFDLLSRIGEELWRSYEQRLRIIRGEGADVSRQAAPRLEEGLGPERAYYNLAGFNVALAKARFDSAAPWWPTASLEQRSDLLDEVAHDLDAASKVYREVAELRARRYRNFPHPHHAACIHGNAIVAYHQAALLNRPEYLVDAAHWVAAGLRERWQVAFYSPDVPDERIISNDDVVKSLELLVKISVAGSMAAQKGTGEQVGNALGAVSGALTELVNWNSQHGFTAGG
jgi:hypothetical protein